MLQHFIIKFLLYIFAYQSLKTNVSSKGGRSRLRSKCSDSVDLIGNFWYFEKLVAEEKWTHLKGDRNRGLDCTILRGKVIENRLIPGLPHSGLSYIPQL